MTTTKKLVFATVTVLLTSALAIGTIVAVDVYLHRKYMDLLGLNVWGYRGPAVGSKQPNEWRLAVVGESTAFGYGVHWKEAFPAYLQERLRQAGARPVTVVNLAYNNEGAHSYKYTLKDYDYLEYDAVLFYSGYNDIGGNTEVFRHDSVVFRLTGYLPLLPLIAKEKAMVIRSGGRLEDAYLNRKTTFRPNIAQRATAGALEAAVTISESLDRQFSDGVSDYAHIRDAAAEEGRECGPE